MQNQRVPSDAEESPVLLLVRKCQEGDQSAFGDLVCIFREKAYALAYSYLNHHQDAEDVSQEAFVRAFRKISAFDPMVGSFGSWLLRIVANLSLNKLRWKKIRNRMTFSLDRNINGAETEEPMPMQVADPSTKIDPHKSTEKSLENKRVEDAMAALSEQQRTALHLKFVQGYKISEVAKIMNLAEGTVKSHLFRGIENLKGSIGDLE